MTPERHHAAVSELRDLHLGKAIHGDVDLAAREHQIKNTLQAISTEIAEHQFRPQQVPDNRDRAERMTELALTFPSLSVNTPGIVPWDQYKLDDLGAIWRSE